MSLILLTESQFSWTFLPCTKNTSRSLWKVGMGTWARPNLNIGHWFWTQMYTKSKKFSFFSFFLLIEFGQIKEKVENVSFSRPFCVNKHDFKCTYNIPYESTHRQLQFWTKKISRSKFYILPIYGQTDPKTAIVAEPAALMVVTPPARSPGGLSLARRPLLLQSRPAIGSSSSSGLRSGSFLTTQPCGA